MARNLEAGVVLAGSIAAYVFVPHDALLPIAWALLAIAVCGVFGIRAYMRRWHAALADGDRDAIPIREREFLLTEFGVLLALVGLSAFVILVIEYAD